MLEKFNHFWDKNHEFLIVFIFICLVMHLIRQHQKYKTIPREISSKLWYDVYLMHNAVKVIVEEQVLSIGKAQSMIEGLENIKLNKNGLDNTFKFTNKLNHFDKHLNGYLLFLKNFIDTQQSQVIHKEIEIQLIIQDKKSIHHRFKKQLKTLENELWPVSH